MNNKQRTQKIRETWYKYHIPHTSNLHRLKQNAIFLNTHNSKEHEDKKLDLGYDCQKQGGRFITEAERNMPDENGLKKIVDFVDLLADKEHEIIHKHETDFEVREYRRKGVIPIFTNPMKCDGCRLTYPRRSKKNFCQICKKEGK